MTPAQKLDRSRIAKELQDNQVLQDALETIAAQAYKAFASAETNAERANAQCFVRCAGIFKRALESVVKEGTLALDDIKRARIKRGEAA